MIKRLFSVLVFVLTTGYCWMAQAEWVSFAGQGVARPEIRIDQQADHRLQLNITLSGVEIENVAIDGADYTQVRIPGHWFTLDQGQPELPFITSSLIIPDAGTPVVRVTKSTWRAIGTNPVVPSKGNIPRTVDPSTVPYSFGAVYTSDGIFPAEEASLARPFIMRDFRGVSLRINAVRWDAGSGQLLALESMTLEVETSGAGGINIKQRPAKGDQPVRIDPQFANLYRLGFDNYQTSDKYNMVAVGGRLLVVSHDSFMGPIQPFVEWKRSMGLKVELISTGSVGGTTAGIQGAIDALYAEPEGLTYVILVGDQAQVPSYSGTYEGADDDTRYGNQEGDDYYPDLFVSRISGSNPADIQTQINKFIRYERDPDPGADWYHIGAGLASNQGEPSDLERAGWLRDDMLNYSFSQVHEIYQPEGTTSDITTAVNAGVSLINYIGHGTGSSWTNPYFNVPAIQALTNGWKNPWILDISCSNGDFSEDECFAESWMRAGSPEQPHGALAIYSASSTTPWVPPCIMVAEAVDLMVADQANVLGSLYYHGIMKVMDEYPGNVQLVEQYNIFGDCSLMIRTDAPIVPNMYHDDVIALGATVFPVDTGLENLRVAIYSNGQLHGVGVTDASGHVDVALENPVTVPGEVTMTVTGYNLLTQIIPLQGEIPILVDIQQPTIPVGMTSEITITLGDPPAAKTVTNVTVTIEGLGVSGLEAVTDAQGVAVFSITPEFGETLLVSGVEFGADYDLFKRGLAVTGAADLTNAQVLAAVPSIGMSGTLAPNLEGTVTGTSDVVDFDLLLTGSGLDLLVVGSGTTVAQNVFPSSTGTVFATLLKSGHNIFEVEIDVIPANGTLAGTVILNGDGDGLGLTGVHVYGFNEGDDPNGVPLFDLVTDASGAYVVTTQMPVGNYDLYAVKFGYSDYFETFSLMHGVNNHVIAMDLAPLGVLTGRVSELAGDSPVNAIIQIFRLDNNDQMALINTDIAGGYTSPALPYYDYRVIVSSYLFEVQSHNITFALPSTVQDFQMVPTIGKILVVDHSSSGGKSGQHSAKLGKDGVVLAKGYDAPENRSASDLVTDLATLNYTIDLVTSDSYNYDDWFSYDLVLVSAGGNTNNFPTTLKNDMLSFVAADGKLFVEGGEVGYNNRNDLEFSTKVLHLLYWRADFVSNLIVNDPYHAVMSVPNTIVGPVIFSYTGFGDSDVLIPTGDAAWPASWSTAPTRASIICYDPNPAPEGGQIVYFTFNYSALDAVGRIEILQNAVAYLSLQELGTATLAGRVRVHEATDDSDVTLTLTPGNTTFQTGPDGNFTFWGMVEGSYQVTATKPGFSSSVVDVVLTEGELVTQNLYLVPIVTNTFCSAPDMDIPDNDPEGVYFSLTIDEPSTVSDLGVFVDINHTAVSDMVIDLISPSGTIVRLHQNQTGGEHGLVGWYPADITPQEDLSTFLGESIQGDWLLHVMDVGPQDWGHVNSWCLVLSYAEAIPSPVAEDDLPRILSLDGNYPNPFNPLTVIRFSIPQARNSELVVYDVRGVRVRTLVSGVMEAGHHEVTWTGRDDLGRLVSSGTYFYRLTSEGQNLVGKMILIK